MESLFFSAIGEAELRHGVAIVPPGRRRTALADALERMMAHYFAGRILPFDSAAARAYAVIMADRVGGWAASPRLRTVKSPPSRVRAGWPWRPATSTISPPRESTS